MKPIFVTFLGAVGALAQSMQMPDNTTHSLGKPFRLVTIHRPVPKCQHSRPSVISYIENKSFNFSQVIFPTDLKAPVSGYTIDKEWLQGHVLQDSMISVEGTHNENDFRWRCVLKCLENYRCASWGFLMSRTTTTKNGLMVCQFYNALAGGILFFKHEKDKAGLELVSVHNLVCPSDVQRYVDMSDVGDQMDYAATSFREMEKDLGLTRSSDGELTEAEEEWFRMREEERTKKEADDNQKWVKPVNEGKRHSEKRRARG